jgi:argininosuccinate synthase
MDMNKKLVLAFSGGLDTSFCVKYLKEEKGFDVYTAIANTGGFSDEELKVIEDRAYQPGSEKACYHRCYQRILRKMYPLYGNGKCIA